MNACRCRTFGCLVISGAAILLPAAASAASRDELARQASWQPPSAVDVKVQVLPWLIERAVDAAARSEVEDLWAAADAQPANWTGDEILSRVAQSLAIVDPRVQELINVCSQARPAHDLPELVVLQDESLPPWARANLRLVYGSWLAHQQLYDECHEQLASLQPAEVCHPAGLLFYQSVAAYRRLEKAECLATLRKLRENPAALPRRYETLAKLMQADLEPLKPDSLDEISRLMDSVKVRLGHGRAGTKVRKEEDDVIAKLDKLIKQLEQQAQASAAAAASGQGSQAPSSPMQDSMPGGGTGPGNVGVKDLGAKTDWGNLPPKEREEALQQLGKDLPSHYRDVIEEYFRKLARDREQR
jgi:hypothetical protein